MWCDEDHSVGSSVTSHTEQIALNPCISAGICIVSGLDTPAGRTYTHNAKESGVNKTEMAKKLAGKTDLSQAKAAEVVDAIFSSEPGHGIIAVELDAGRDVSIAGFGKFETRRRKARQGRNPATGETIQIAAATVPAFKAAKGLKDRVAI